MEETSKNIWNIYYNKKQKQLLINVPKKFSRPIEREHKKIPKRARVNIEELFFS